MKKIVVGSKNPTKLTAVKEAFLIVLPEEPTFVFKMLDAPSGVNEQPLQEEEAIQGARNRAQYVRQETGADYAIGIE
nr:DUF84 family protein [Candidatus Woesebacteria bacterium]